MNARPVIAIIGLLTAIIGAAMIPCALIDLADGRASWTIFGGCAFATIFIGLIAALSAWDDTLRLGLHEAFGVTVFAWVAVTFAAAAPMALYGLSLTDAVFEATSGLTTTGATVMTGLDQTPRGLLLWRAILQWIGGVGLIVTAMAVFPALRVGGMQLFKLESSDQSDKILPRVREIAIQIGVVYLILSVLCALFYASTGLDAFEAIAHSMTTVSAGGFSTTDASFGAFYGEGAEHVATVFMCAAAMPFGLFVLFLRGDLTAFFRDPQPRLFFAILIASITLIAFWTWANDVQTGESPLHALSHITFSVASVITGTGYGTADYAQWGSLPGFVFLMLMLAGGCAGSAACGIKMFRIQIAASAALSYSKKLAHPHRVTLVRYAGRVVDESDLKSVIVFIAVFLGTWVAGILAFLAYGLDPMTALSGSAALLANVGPGLGEIIGPAGNYQSLPDIAKWTGAALMLLGRLELMVVLVMLTPRFWRD